ncbi:MAG: tetratricopeptide repeat protein, partial [Alistipes sp.]|nr:tetratricopeptide repeat protein [Alistipes sp.]
MESLMSERPDSALVVLQGIDTTQFHSAEDKALYTLLYTQAEDKNYIDALDDSKISIAVEYYKNSDDQYHNMLSYYYLARVQFNNKEYSNSITSL